MSSLSRSAGGIRTGSFAVVMNSTSDTSNGSSTNASLKSDSAPGRAPRAGRRRGRGRACRSRRARTRGRCCPPAASRAGSSRAARLAESGLTTDVEQSVFLAIQLGKLLRNQQVSGSSPLAGSNRINNLRRSRVQTDPTRVTTVSPPIRRWSGLATPTPRRSTNSSGQPAHSTRGQASPPPDMCGTDRRSPASLKASDTEPAAVRGDPAGRTSSVTATPGRTPPLPARTPDPSFRSENGPQAPPRTHARHPQAAFTVPWV